MNPKTAKLNRKMAAMPTWADIFGFIAAREKIVGHRLAVREAVEKFGLKQKASALLD